MSVRLLLDTNVLIYPLDASEPVKQRAAAIVLDEVQSSGVGSVSTQVLSEFYSVMTTKLRPRVSAESALASLERQAILWPVFQVTTEVIIEAARITQHYPMNFWDAQLWAVARVNRIPYILTEDLKDGALISGVRVSNPLRPGWRLTDLIP